MASGIHLTYPPGPYGGGMLPPTLAVYHGAPGIDGGVSWEFRGLWLRKVGIAFEALPVFLVPRPLDENQRLQKAHS